MEFVVITPEIDSLYKEIKRRIHRLQSGGTIDSIKRLGVNPGKQIGASFSALKTLASNYERNDTLAKLLWADKKREEQIMALYLFALNPTTEDVEKRLSDAISLEVSEYAGTQWLIDVEGKEEILYTLYNTQNVFVQAALICLSAKISTQAIRCNLTLPDYAEKWICRDYNDNSIELIAERYRFKFNKG